MAECVCLNRIVHQIRIICYGGKYDYHPKSIWASGVSCKTGTKLKLLTPNHHKTKKTIAMI